MSNNCMIVVSCAIYKDVSDNSIVVNQQQQIKFIHNYGK